MKKEHWAFSESELTDPSKCKSNDELVACIDLDDDWEGEKGLITEPMERNLTDVSNYEAYMC